MVRVVADPTATHARPPADARGRLGGGVDRRPVNVLSGPSAPSRRTAGSRSGSSSPPVRGRRGLRGEPGAARGTRRRRARPRPRHHPGRAGAEVLRRARHPAVGHGRPRRVVDVARWTYQNCQRLITWSFVIWLYLRRNAFFPRVRNTIITLDVLGLVGYFLYPTAPPRLTPGFGVRGHPRPDPGQPALVAGRVADEPLRRRPEPALRLRAPDRHHRLPRLPAPA